MSKRMSATSRSSKFKSKDGILSLRDRINNRLYDLEDMMAEQLHLSEPRKVEAHIQTITKFWSSLDDSDRDYIHGCRYALEEKHEWKYE